LNSDWAEMPRIEVSDIAQVANRNQAPARVWFSVCNI
jgi:hypothetical protein